MSTIEAIEFRIQFVVISGFQHLLSVISAHEVANGLQRELAVDSENADVIYERIIELLPKASTVTEASYDGSIVVYLYCLSERDLSLAHKASTEIRDTEGLFWSRRMARAITRYYHARKLQESIEFKSVKLLPSPYSLTMRKQLTSLSIRYSLYPSAIAVSPTADGSVGIRPDASSAKAFVDATFKSPNEMRDMKDYSNPVQKLEFAFAS